MTESEVCLREGTSGNLITACLCDEVNNEHLASWDRDWVPAMRDFCAGKAPGQTPEDSHWDWRRKSRAIRGILGYRSFALVCQDQLQGLMMVNDVTSARLHEQFGKPLIYVEFLAAAPWNRPALQDPPRYRGVGQVFVLAAIETSRDAGFKGRTGLHSLRERSRSTNRNAASQSLGQTRRIRISHISK